MIFENGIEFYKTIEETDLYNDEKCLYVFLYNDSGSICVYNISNEEAMTIDGKAKMCNEHWSAFLGAGGEIFDNPMKFCNAEYNCKWRRV